MAFPDDLPYSCESHELAVCRYGVGTRFARQLDTSSAEEFKIDAKNFRSLAHHLP